MPVKGARLALRWLLVCVALGAGAAALYGAAKVQHRLARGWGQYREPAAVGADEARARHLVLSDAPFEARFTGLFDYFAAGFVRHAGPSYARVQYGGAGSRNGYALDGLEGFARTAPLLAVWIYSGRDPAEPTHGRLGRWAEVLRAGILSGVDPQSSQYWGDFQDQDQRIVEAADIARVLWLTRDRVWDHFSAAEKQRVSAWLTTAGRTRTPHTNWMLFPVVINLVLASLQEPDDVSRELQQRARAVYSDYKQYYLANGWFYDPPHGVDFYNAWGISYELFWIQKIAPDFEPEFIRPALQKSAELTQHLISPQGIPIMGRSVCYRTAVPVPLLAATLVDPDRFPAGRAARSLDLVWRYFVAHDSLRDGALTQGYFAADLRFLDVYSGTGSCHWGLRSLVLAFLHQPGDRFWTAPHEPLPVEKSDYRLELTLLGWIVEGRQASGEITITIPKNTEEVTEPDDHSWMMRLQETILRVPVRPSNHDVKYGSRSYSSADPYPLKH